MSAEVDQSNRWSSTSHTDPRSAVRSELKRQKVFQSWGPETYAGALTSSQVTAAAADTSPSSRKRRLRRQITRIPPSRKSG